MTRNVAFAAAAVVATACAGPSDPTVASVTGLRFPSAPVQLIRTDTVRLTRLLLDREGQPVPSARSRVQFTIRNTAIVRFRDDDLLMGVAVGSSWIVASIDHLVDSVEVRVREIPTVVASVPDGRLRLPGEVTTIAASVEGIPRMVALRVLGETRWLDDRAVVTTFGNIVIAQSPGTVRLEVTAPLSTPDTVVIDVHPDQPTVLFISPEGALRTGTEVRLRGWGLDAAAVTAVRIGDRAMQILSRDSATIRVMLSAEDVAGCEGGSRRSIQVTGATLFLLSSIVTVRANDLEVEPGMPVDVPSGSCLKLPANSNAQWALAVVDDSIWGATNVAVTNSTLGTEFPVRLVDGGTKSAAAPNAARSPDVRMATRESTMASRPGFADSPRPESRIPDSAVPATVAARPYQIGDEIRLSPSTFPDVAGLYRVRAIRGAFVLFYFVGADEVPDKVQQRIAAAVDTMNVAFNALLGPMVSGPPRDENGQFQVYLHYRPGGLGLNGIAGAHGLWLSLQDRLDENLYEVLLHEYAHSYQFSVQADSRAAGRSAGEYRYWNWEGLADFTASELRRRAHDIASNANVTAAELDAQDLHAITAEQLYAGGHILNGYYYSAGLFRDLVRRWRMLTASSEDDAFRVVFRAAALGWWGCDLGDCSAEGIADVFAARTGVMRTASDFLLDWALAQAADDRIDSTVWRNELFFLASGTSNPVAEAPKPGWRPAGTFVAGKGDVTFTAYRGGVSWVAIGDPNALGTTLQLPQDSRWRWRLLRIR